MQRQIPSTPRVRSLTTPLGTDGTAEYLGTTTRSGARRSTRLQSEEAESGTGDVSSASEAEDRARSRSRDADTGRRRRTGDKMTTATASAHDIDATSSSTHTSPKAARKPNGAPKTNGHLSPPTSSDTAATTRTPSPLGLIPIHASWRNFIHRHEIPRKALHISIGFLTLTLYARNYETSDIHPTLLTLLIPIAFTDLMRHSYAPFNRFYIRCLGAFMRESEAHDKYNGVIWYLLGAWSAMRFFPKDVAVMSVVLLSWCDTAASTFGRAYGRYTPAVGRGKSLAGSAAAAVVGAGAAALFWGVLAPICQGPACSGPFGLGGLEDVDFAYQGVLALPTVARFLPSGARALFERIARPVFDNIGKAIGWSQTTTQVTGTTSLTLLSTVAGLIASGAEALDLFGWDDNVTIPLLCGAGLWGFLGVFGGADACVRLRGGC